MKVICKLKNQYTCFHYSISYLVAQFDGFQQLQTDPGTRQCPLFVGMVAIVALAFRAGAAERKQEFLVITIGQNWMVELSWRQDLTFDDADRVVF